jgi:hypothetical protein
LFLGCNHLRAVHSSGRRNAHEKKISAVAFLLFYDFFFGKGGSLWPFFGGPSWVAVWIESAAAAVSCVSL